MNELDKFHEEAIAHGVCSDYLQKWDSAKSKRQIMDVALSSQGIIFLCTSIQQGWGLSSEYIAKTFERYLNHRYVKEGEYTSCIYVSHDGEVVVDTTLTLFVDCNVRVIVPRNYFCKIYVCGKSNVEVCGYGRVIVVRYGDDVKLNIEKDTLKQYKVIIGEYE